MMVRNTQDSVYLGKQQYSSGYSQGIRQFYVRGTSADNGPQWLRVFDADHTVAIGMKWNDKYWLVGMSIRRFLQLLFGTMMPFTQPNPDAPWEFSFEKFDSEQKMKEKMNWKD